MITGKKYILISCAVLAACGGDEASNVTVNQVAPDTEPQKSRIVFQPIEGRLALPNDLLFGGTIDGTLESPAESEAKENNETVNLGDPASALGGVDGWSTQLPMQINVDLLEGEEVDASTVGISTVFIVQTDCSLGLSNCTTFTPLTYGVDYVAIGGASTITVVPIKPLQSKTNYIVGITNGVLDTSGESVSGSEFYDAVSVSDTVINGDLGALQAAVNGYEGIIFAATGTNPDNLIYTASWTTSSVLDAPVAAVGITQASFTPQISNITAHPLVNTANLGLGLPGNADIYTGSITLPYFSPIPTDANPFAPLTDTWEALCDNGVLLASLALDGFDFSVLPEGDNNAQCTGFGLADYGLDTERYITQFNPIPSLTAVNNLEVLITVPTTGSNWPVVIFQHGITRLKEDALFVADSFAQAGFATVAIDLPLHGGRGFNTGSALQVNATSDNTAGIVGDVTHYLNLGFILTARDNLRQSYVDIAGLRLGIAGGFSCTDGVTVCDDGFNTSEVHFVGLSLGGITGVGFNAIATASGLPSSSATYVAAGGGIVPLLFDSQSFGGLVSGTILGAAEITDPNSAEAAATLAAFGFAAQTIIAASDPNNLAATASAVSPTFVIQVNGDAVVPNNTSFGGLTFGGTEAIARLLGVNQVFQGDAAASEGFIKFTEGGHTSLINPGASDPATPAVTAEMQSIVANFLAGGEIILGASSVGLVE